MKKLFEEFVGHDDGSNDLDRGAYEDPRRWVTSWGEPVDRRLVEVIASSAVSLGLYSSEERDLATRVIQGMLRGDSSELDHFARYFPLGLPDDFHVASDGLIGYAASLGAPRLHSSHSPGLPCPRLVFSVSGEDDIGRERRVEIDAEAIFSWALSDAGTRALVARGVDVSALRAGRVPYAGTIGFYGSEFHCFSNFSSFRLRWRGEDFDTSEHAYHWEKFPDAPKVRQLISDARSAHDAFKIGDTYGYRRRKDWSDVRVDVMREILRAKVDQHPYVKKKLLETGDRTLVEDSWRDSYWGWGADRLGENMLGKLWMEIRTQLRATDEPAQVK